MNNNDDAETCTDFYCQSINWMMTYNAIGVDIGQKYK